VRRTASLRSLPVEWEFNSTGYRSAGVAARALPDQGFAERGRKGSNATTDPRRAEVARTFNSSSDSDERMAWRERTGVSGG
jgi:hypothetical protein